MRVLLQATLPHAPFNAAIKDGSASAKMKRILEDLRPEATYLTALGGHRTVILIVNLEDASKIPALAEPFFLLFDADVRISPIMSPEDLGRANLDAIAKKWA